MIKDDYVDKRVVSVDLDLFDPGYILRKEILKFLPKNRFNNVLDYGAGNSPWKKFIIYDNYYKADIQQNKNNDIDAIITVNRPLPLANGSYDLLLLMDVLAHTNNFDFTISECNRLLCHGGELIISVPFIYRENETPFDYYRPTYFGMEDILARNHFKINKIKKVGNFYYTIFSLINERNIKNGEKIKSTFLGKIINKLLRLFLLIFNKTIFSSSPSNDDGIYHHLLISAIKHEV